MSNLFTEIVDYPEDNIDEEAIDYSDDEYDPCEDYENFDYFYDLVDRDDDYDYRWDEMSYRKYMSPKSKWDIEPTEYELEEDE